MRLELRNEEDLIEDATAYNKKPHMKALVSGNYIPYRVLNASSEWSFNPSILDQDQWGFNFYVNQADIKIALDIINHDFDIRYTNELLWNSFLHVEGYLNEEGKKVFLNSEGKLSEDNIIPLTTLIKIEKFQETCAYNAFRGDPIMKKMFAYTATQYLWIWALGNVILRTFKKHTSRKNKSAIWITSDNPTKDFETIDLLNYFFKDESEDTTSANQAKYFGYLYREFRELSKHLDWQTYVIAALLSAQGFYFLSCIKKIS